MKLVSRKNRLDVLLIVSTLKYDWRRSKALLNCWKLLWRNTLKLFLLLILYALDQCHMKLWGNTNLKKGPSFLRPLLVFLFLNHQKALFPTNFLANQTSGGNFNLSFPYFPPPSLNRTLRLNYKAPTVLQRLEKIHKGETEKLIKIP